MHEKEKIRPKWLTVAQLRRVLAEMPDDYELICNANTMNLAVYRPVDKDHAEYVGFIDFMLEGEFCS